MPKKLRVSTRDGEASERANNHSAKLVCGIVMPISATDGCSEEHWSEVLDIVTDAIDDSDMEARLVSDAVEVGVIQRRIIQNLYENPLVVCDVSGKNANVMFELGIRIAFDKPTIIIKDDVTVYSFDTAPIEHLEYPRDLRFAKILEFKERLTEKIKATLSASKTDPTYSTFLKHFGQFKTATLKATDVTAQDYILDELKSLRLSVEKLNGRREPLRGRPNIRPGRLDMCLRGLSDAQIERVMTAARAHEAEIKKSELRDRGPQHKHIIVTTDIAVDLKRILDDLSASITE